MTYVRDIKAKSVYDRERYQRIRTRRLAARVPDPIESLTTDERAYIAGLVDGEGSIFVGAVGPHRHKTTYPILVIAMTHRGVIEWLCSRLQSGKVLLHNQTSLRLHPHLKPQFRFTLFGRRAQLLCRTIEPYLKVKHEHAVLVAQFPVDARTGRGRKIGSDVAAIRQTLRERINALNHVRTDLA